MRFFTLVAATAIVTVSAQNATQCNPSALLPLLADPNVATCTADSGLSLTSPPASVSPDVVAKLCASAGCKALIARLASLNLGDCSVGTFKIDSLQNACGSASNSTGTTNSTSTPSTKPVGNGESPSTVPSPAPTAQGAASMITVATSAVVAAVVAALW